MINPYCESLDGFFSELVYYGILKEEDAQCFRADVVVEPTFYILFAAAIVLILINSFVMKAVSQYFRDGDAPLLVSAHDQKIADLDDLGEYEDKMFDESVDKQAIHPVPVLFTDRFRWFLHREDAVLSRRPSATLGSMVQESPENMAMPMAASQASSSTIDSPPQRRHTIVDISAEDRRLVHDDLTTDDELVYNTSTGGDESDERTEGDIITIGEV